MSRARREEANQLRAGSPEEAWRRGLALHVAVARGVRCVALFVPTSAAEIELYGLGEKVESTAPDACSYRFDADNSTLTPELLCAAVLRQLALVGGT